MLLRSWQHGEGSSSILHHTSASIVLQLETIASFRIRAQSPPGNCDTPSPVFWKMLDSHGISCRPPQATKP